ncbi:MAG TPA: hypothetical protein VK745_13175 [Polyangiaceae bacterium]|jgi:hypothetical protein|nr:hypothetical protein [Polyangiaceae bacterium]
MLARTVVVSPIAFTAACSGSTSSSGGPGDSSAGSAGQATAGSPASSAGGSSVSGSGGMIGGAGKSSGFGGGTPNAGGAGGAGGGAGGTSSASGGMSGAGGSAQAGAGGMSNLNPPGKQSLIWVWLDYKNSIDTVIQNKASFTHVSPALYQLNYAYTSGTPKLLNTDDNFDGLSSKDISDTVHAAGLKVQPLMYAGAGNSGTDQGIQNILNDSPSGTQNNFITSMVAECVAKDYDGINLDWEVQGTNYDQYGTKLISFLTAFTAAMHAKNMVVTFDLGGWYTRQCADNGLVDLSQVGHSVDQMIMEDYTGTYGNKNSKACPATPGNANCDAGYTEELDVMCNLPKSVVNIGLISPEGGNGGTNPFAADALAALDSYGFTSVSLWPDDGNFINNNNVQNGSTWYKLLAAWLAEK